VVTSNFGELFVVIAESAATLIGLLFVAVTVSEGRMNKGSAEIGEFRAAASLIAFTNALIVSLYGIVPGNNIGYPALAMGVIGVFFIGAGIKATLAQPPAQQRRRRQVHLMVVLLGVFGFQIFYGLRLLSQPHNATGLEIIGDVLIASLLIGIGRAWEQVGSWDTGIVSSISRLFRRTGSPNDEQKRRPDIS
jgi:hypothetical protein